MDGLGLAGENPTMPAPPKVGPATGFVPAIWLPPVPALGSVGLALGSAAPMPGLKAPDPIGVPTPPGPTPARGPPMPRPPSGWPKKPIARGALFWPIMMGFQSSLPVIGSMYFLRRKRMLLVLTSASTLGG